METPKQRTERILSLLKKIYPWAKTYDLDGRGLHFVAEIEPVDEHPEYDRAVEVIVNSRPHKHRRMTQQYTVLSGTLKLNVDDKCIHLKKGQLYTVKPGQVHYATSDIECWVEIFSQPGWTQEDHIPVTLPTY